MTAGPCVSLGKPESIIDGERNHWPRRSEAEPHWLLGCRSRRCQPQMLPELSRLARREPVTRPSFEGEPPWLPPLPSPCPPLPDRSSFVSRATSRLRKIRPSMQPAPIASRPSRSPPSYLRSTRQHTATATGFVLVGARIWRCCLASWGLGVRQVGMLFFCHS